MWVAASTAARLPSQRRIFDRLIMPEITKRISSDVFYTKLGTFRARVPDAVQRAAHRSLSLATDTARCTADPGPRLLWYGRSGVPGLQRTTPRLSLRSAGSVL